AEPLLGLLLRLAFGLLVVAPSVLFLALARLGGLALDPLTTFALRPAARVLLGNTTLLRFPHACVGERMRPGAALLLGQRAQHDAGRLWRHRGRGRRRGSGRFRGAAAWARAAFGRRRGFC